MNQRWIAPVAGENFAPIAQNQDYATNVDNNLIITQNNNIVMLQDNELTYNIRLSKQEIDLIEFAFGKYDKNSDVAIMRKMDDLMCKIYTIMDNKQNKSFKYIKHTDML